MRIILAVQSIYADHQQSLLVYAVAAGCCCRRMTLIVKIVMPDLDCQASLRIS